MITRRGLSNKQTNERAKGNERSKDERANVRTSDAAAVVPASRRDHPTRGRVRARAPPSRRSRGIERDTPTTTRRIAGDKDCFKERRDPSGRRHRPRHARAELMMRKPSRGETRREKHMREQSRRRTRDREDEEAARPAEETERRHQLRLVAAFVFLMNRHLPVLTHNRRRCSGRTGARQKPTRDDIGRCRFVSGGRLFERRR